MEEGGAFGFSKKLPSVWYWLALDDSEVFVAAFFHIGAIACKAGVAALFPIGALEFGACGACVMLGLVDVCGTLVKFWYRKLLELEAGFFREAASAAFGITGGPEPEGSGKRPEARFSY